MTLLFHTFDILRMLPRFLSCLFRVKLMFEARLDNSRSQCAFAATLREAAETLRSIAPSADTVYIYEFQTQKLVKVLKYRD